VPALRDLQLGFVAALFDARDDSVHAHIREDGIDARERVDVYRNNLREGFIKAMAIGFPVIERLGGTDYFRQLALAFLHAHPSRSGNLHHIGEPFANWLRGRFEGTRYSYFADVAALEWAYQHALIAPDVPAITADGLREVAPADYERITFQLHPACGFIQSAFPIVRIWRANQPETSSDEVIDLASGGDNVMVIRTPECVELHRLPPAQFALFDALGRGETLGLSLERAQAIEAQIDPGPALRQLFELQIVTHIGLRLPSP
jgi:hypothetical protein